MQACKSVLLQVVSRGALAVVCFALALSASAQNAPSRNSATVADSSQISDLPDSPGTVLAKAQQPETLPPSSQQSSGAANTAPGPTQSQAGQNQPGPQKPVGTAAADAPTTTGVAASQPAGVAIAPAKQHRTRTIVLRVGAIIGVGVAVGTIVALSAATPPRPPGAH
jgi:hypothetical protein